MIANAPFVMVLHRCDVAIGDWYGQAAAWATIEGNVSGFDDDVFPKTMRAPVRR